MDAYIKMERPFDTSDISDGDFNYLLDAVKGKRASLKEDFGVDSWDKRSMSGARWANKLKEDRENGTSWAWTTIPNFVV